MERLSRLAQNYNDFIVQERLLDHYVDLLKTNRLDENTSLDVVEKVVAYFQVNFFINFFLFVIDRGRIWPTL